MSKVNASRRNRNRLMSVIVTLMLVVMANLAISSVLNAKSTVPAYPDSPRPKSTVPAYPDSPRPKSTVPAYPDSPRPKSTVPIYPDSPRP